ncbi:hypothetical protein [Massilia sp. KIM]|uniref:hypothetical protein n=1 Tax=Massilia sp. KIM TaxID=1955422 RepID=UPI00117ECD33|nr:hypothetical protein [Massilia sp. KIM]
MTAPVASKPFSISLIGPAVSIFNELCAHVRAGYIVNTDHPIEFFPNGNLSLMLILGSPDDTALAQAKTSSEESAARELADYERRIKEEAKRLVEHQQREELAKKVAAEVAEHQKKIAEIQKQAAAALAKLDSSK